MSSYSGKEGDSRGLSARQMNNLFEAKNGRVINLISNKCDKNMGDHGLFDTTLDPKKYRVPCQENFTYDAVRNIHVTNPLSEAYFSDANLQILQDQIRYSVYKESEEKYVIGLQSEKELNILRRSIYLQHGEYLPNEVSPIKEQIRKLNSIVVSYSVGRILNEIKQYQHYIYDVENMAIPIEHPVNISSAGSRTLKSVTSTF